MQIDRKKLAEFRALSAVESKKNEVRYGPECGLITLSVFVKKKGGVDEQPPLLDLGLAAEDARAVARGVLPAVAPRNLLALRAQLREGIERGQGSRGLIVAEEGKAKEDDPLLREVEIETGPVPVFLASVRYYKAKTKK
jgi:hypothetical protein